VGEAGSRGAGQATINATTARCARRPGIDSSLTRPPAAHGQSCGRARSAPWPRARASGSGRCGDGLPPGANCSVTARTGGDLCSRRSCAMPICGGPATSPRRGARRASTGATGRRCGRCRSRSRASCRRPSARRRVAVRLARRAHGLYLCYPAPHRNAVWQADRKQLPVLVVPPGRWRGRRPWVTLFLDDLSRAMMAWAISLVLDAEGGDGDSMRVWVHIHETPTATGAPRPGHRFRATARGRQAGPRHRGSGRSLAM
jgi:hypothetical protein